MQQSKGRLFKTSVGRVGLAWASPREGDDLVIFDWAPAPHLLRRVVSRDDQAYTLVSQVYMGDVMNGEVYELGIRKQDVTLV